MGREIHVCVPVLRRYDLLRRMLLSLRESTVTPTSIRIIDNGCDLPKLKASVAGTISNVYAQRVLSPLGVAASWNCFLDMPEERIIVNDDIVFGPESLERLTETSGDIVFGHGFSCFLIRNSCVAKVGRFDEDISPGYAYYEDCDYMERIRNECRRGNWVTVKDVEADLIHGDQGKGSCTYRAGTEAEISDHWKRHHHAHQNFLRKYGAEPEELERRFKEWQRETEVQV